MSITASFRHEKGPLSFAVLCLAIERPFQLFAPLPAPLSPLTWDVLVFRLRGKWPRSTFVEWPKHWSTGCQGFTSETPFFVLRRPPSTSNREPP